MYSRIQTAISFSTTMSAALQAPERPSKRLPTMETTLNTADELERLLQKDGFAIYRCTYRNNSVWEKFMTYFLYHIKHFLESYNSLDLDGFAPTLCRSLF